MAATTHRGRKTALTRAVNRGDKAALVRVCREAQQAWGTDNWPDDWMDWCRALEDHGLHLTAEELFY